VVNQATASRDLVTVSIIYSLTGFNPSQKAEAFDRPFPDQNAGAKGRSAAPGRQQ
jgi:hypothetical protein